MQQVSHSVPIIDTYKWFINLQLIFIFEGAHQNDYFHIQLINIKAYINV